MVERANQPSLPREQAMNPTMQAEETSQAFWTRRAQQAVKEGYQPRNLWERDLKKHLKRCFPELLAELTREKCLNAYLMARTHSAMQLENFLLAQGASPEDAREDARQRLLPRPPEEEERTQAWESQSGEDSAAAAGSLLLQQSSPSPSQPKRTTPRTL